MKAFDLFWNLLYPPKCVSCDVILPYDVTAALCPICEAKFLTEKGFLCPECRLPHGECDCSVPLLRHRVKKAMHLCEYIKEESVARDLILAAKDENYEYLYRKIAEELFVLLKNRLPNFREYVITFVPRSRKKTAEFGIDQAKEASKRLAKKAGISWYSLLYHTISREQKSLTAKERKDNRKDAYRLIDKYKEVIEGQKIILYDDVITTGATLASCISLLKKAGAEEVVIMTFGKTYHADKNDKSPIV